MPAGTYILSSSRREMYDPDPFFGGKYWETWSNSIPIKISFNSSSGEDKNYTEYCKSIELGKVSF